MRLRGSNSQNYNSIQGNRSNAALHQLTGCAVLSQTRLTITVRLATKFALRCLVNFVLKDL